MVAFNRRRFHGAVAMVMRSKAPHAVSLNPLHVGPLSFQLLITIPRSSISKPLGIRGGASLSLGLHRGQGAPAPPHVQACSPAKADRDGFHRPSRRRTS